VVVNFFSKGTNFNEVSAAELNQVKELLNNRPEKCLN